jgi:hypothetical protein
MAEEDGGKQAKSRSKETLKEAAEAAKAEEKEKAHRERNE